MGHRVSKEVASAVARLGVRWFESWEPSLDEAFRVLPELETSPHELYRQLLTSPARTRKRTGRGAVGAGSGVIKSRPGMSS
jgi:hypothetical protein